MRVALPREDVMDRDDKADIVEHSLTDTPDLEYPRAHAQLETALTKAK
jgi:hypothetical protein